MEFSIAVIFRIQKLPSCCGILLRFSCIHPKVTFPSFLYWICSKNIKQYYFSEGDKKKYEKHFKMYKTEDGQEIIDLISQLESEGKRVILDFLDPDDERSDRFLRRE